MEQVINDYLEYMKTKFSIRAAMIAGSYVTKTMGPKSDIDIFFIGSSPYATSRGREFYKGIEFEYFISPEWKYYDRLRKDTASVQIYAGAKIIYDPEGKLKTIQDTAVDQLQRYSVCLSDDMKKDYAFWLDTIQNDGEDLFDKGQFSQFLFFTGYELAKMNDLLCKLKNHLPVYEKYAVKQITVIDKDYGALLEQFLLYANFELAKKQLWTDLCLYLKHELGDIDVTVYQKNDIL